MPGFAGWRKNQQRQPAETRPYGLDWTAPCGTYFKKEQDLSWHIIDCDECDRVQRKKGFRMPKGD